MCFLRVRLHSCNDPFVCTAFGCAYHPTIVSTFLSLCRLISWPDFEERCSHIAHFFCLRRRFQLTSLAKRAAGALLVASPLYRENIGRSTASICQHILCRFLLLFPVAVVRDFRVTIHRRATRGCLAVCTTADPSLSIRRREEANKYHHCSTIAELKKLCSY